MQITYRNNTLERLTVFVNVIVSVVVSASFVIMLGFKTTLIDLNILHTVQVSAFFCFLVEKIFRFINAKNRAVYLRAIWFEFPLLLILVIVMAAAGRYAETIEPAMIRITAVWVYLVLQVVDKVCRTTVYLISSGRNPTKLLIFCFVALIMAGAGLLMLPRSYNCENVSFIDALFTATSATCVTGLTVKDTGIDFSLAGQSIIMCLIQLGGLGIMVFGAVFAMLLRQATSVKESVAMQDALSGETLSKIGVMIGFIFTATIIIESVGAFLLYGMWSDAIAGPAQIEQHKIFSSIFHSVSAFCNAGFGLATRNLVDYRQNWQVYGVICQLIIIGGLGFGVIYDIVRLVTEKIKIVIFKRTKHKKNVQVEMPKRLTLQTKIVLSVSAILIVAGAILLLVFERCYGNSNFDWRDAYFQSVTSRTAGFNTVDIGKMSSAGKMIITILMFIGGSPGSTAGGIKTVTLCVIIMTAWANIRKRNEVEIFKRSIKPAIVGRAITVTLVFSAVLFAATMLLAITERHNNFALENIIFEATSAIGTVGLSTGLTTSLTSSGKLIIIILMLIGRLGPLTLLASLTFNTKPGRYSYPNGTLVVG